MATFAIERPVSAAVESFLNLAAARPDVLAELKAASDDGVFVELCVTVAAEAGIGLTPAEVWQQMLADRASVRFVSLADVEEVAEGMLGMRMSGGHTSNRPPQC